MTIVTLRVPQIQGDDLTISVDSDEMSIEEMIEGLINGITNVGKLLELMRSGTGK